ncbi:MAG TPA: hypothetical protein VMI52_03725 [Acetobacteraceae bacterium]|nr:hypothetical protein [Acetobacteraceae bacterium]
MRQSIGRIYMDFGLAIVEIDQHLVCMMKIATAPSCIAQCKYMIGCDDGIFNYIRKKLHEPHSRQGG